MTASTTYRIVHPVTGETIYRTSNTETVLRERKAGHIATAVSRSGCGGFA